MNRVDQGATLTTVSPFLLKKVIDTVAGEIDKCIKLRNGTVLLLTKNLQQAEKLVQLTSLNNNISISINEHNSLNQVKGVVFHHEFKYVSDDEILSNCKLQNVSYT